MSKNNNLKDFLADVADAIRSKTGDTGLINPQDFSARIASIQTGGGGGDTPAPSPTPTPDMPVIGDGKTYLYIKIATKGRMDVPLYFNQTVANGMTIDWGDGSVTQTLSGTGNVSTSHIYAEIGEYVISLDPVDGCALGLGHNSSSYCVLGSTGNNGKVYCNMLQAVEIGKSVTSISDYAFNNCCSLVNIVLPDSVTSIGEHAFYYCCSLASVEIPSSVTSIGEYTFYGCYSLANVTIQQGVTNIDSYAFSNCYSLTNLIIPQGVTSIGNNTFYNCYSLSSVMIPNSVTSIGGDAFDNCYSLASISIPNSVTSIGSYAFYNCYSLTSIEISNSITSIDTCTFSYCYSLASIVIPNGVTSISSYAFSYCYGMAFYDFSQCSAVPTLAKTNAFSSIPSDCKIIVPDALYDEWRAATNWNTYYSYIVKDSEFIR